MEPLPFRRPPDPVDGNGSLIFSLLATRSDRPRRGLPRTSASARTRAKLGRARSAEVTEMTLTAAERRRGVAEATGCISIVGRMTGLAWPLLSLRLDAQGVDSRLIGRSAVHALAGSRGRIVGIFGFVWSGCFAAGPLSAARRKLTAVARGSA